MSHGAILTPSKELEISSFDWAPTEALCKRFLAAEVAQNAKLVRNGNGTVKAAEYGSCEPRTVSAGGPWWGVNLVGRAGYGSAVMDPWQCAFIVSNNRTKYTGCTPLDIRGGEAPVTPEPGPVPTCPGTSVWNGTGCTEPEKHEVGSGVTIAEGRPADATAYAVQFQDYFNKVRERVKSKWVYPRAAGERGIEGQAQIKFYIAKDGQLEYL
jgi:hypothetical protein